MIRLFHGTLAALPTLNGQKSPALSAVLGLALGGLGLGIYFRSVLDFVIPIALVLVLSLFLPGIGTIGGMIFASVYGYYRALDSNRRIEMGLS